MDQNGTGKNEVVGANTYACFNIDDIIYAYDHSDRLTGPQNDPTKNGNTYDFACSDPLVISMDNAFYL